MSASNPWSPKVIIAAAVSFVAPIILAAVAGGVDYLAGTDLMSWDGFLKAVIAGAITSASTTFAAYRKTDPLRLPTIDKAAVEQLPDAPAV